MLLRRIDQRRQRARLVWRQSCRHALRHDEKKIGPLQCRTLGRGCRRRTRTAPCRPLPCNLHARGRSGTVPNAAARGSGSPFAGYCSLFKTGFCIVSCMCRAWMRCGRHIRAVPGPHIRRPNGGILRLFRVFTGLRHLGSFHRLATLRGPGRRHPGDQCGEISIEPLQFDQTLAQAFRGLRGANPARYGLERILYPLGRRAGDAAVPDGGSQCRRHAPAGGGDIRLQSQPFLPCPAPVFGQDRQTGQQGGGERSMP